MAQLNALVYENIARYYARCSNQLSDASSFIHEAEIEITNITTSNYTPILAAGETTSATDAAIEVTMSLLSTIHNSYIGMNNLIGSNSAMVNAVRVINDFVVSHATAEETAAARVAGIDVLAYYVNSITWESDPYIGDYPEQWKILSSQAGYDTSDWDMSE